MEANTERADVATVARSQDKAVTSREATRATFHRGRATGIGRLPTTPARSQRAPATATLPRMARQSRALIALLLTLGLAVLLLPSVALAAPPVPPAGSCMGTDAC